MYLFYFAESPLKHLSLKNSLAELLVEAIYDGYVYLCLTSNQMFFNLRHILLLVGIVAVILSFLFFGRATPTYDVILISGLCLSAVAYLFILFKDSGRNRIIWTFVIIAGICLQWLTEPLMIRLSYLYFLKQNEVDLSRVNQILITKGIHTIWVQDSNLWQRHYLTPEEGMTIKNLIKDKKISSIERDSVKIYYRTFGMLDVSHGLFYFYTVAKPDNRFKHLSGNWYY